MTPPASATKGPVPAAPPIPTAPPLADAGKRKAIIAAGIGLALLTLAGLLYAGASGLLSARSPRGPAMGVLAAPETKLAQAPVLSPPGVQTPREPVLTPPGTLGNPMPDDVIDYLRWLKAFEGRLQRANADLAATATGTIPDIMSGAIKAAEGAFDPGGEHEGGSATTGVRNASLKLDQIVQTLNAMTGEFQQRTPPDPCATLAISYGKTLSEAVRQTVSLTHTIKNIFQTYSGDAGQGAADRQAMLPDIMRENRTKDLSGGVDAAAVSADQALDNVRSRYTDIPADIDKPAFQIKPLQSGFDPGSLLKGVVGF